MQVQNLVAIDECCCITADESCIQNAECFQELQQMQALMLGLAPTSTYFGENVYKIQTRRFQQVRRFQRYFWLL